MELANTNENYGEILEQNSADDMYLGFSIGDERYAIEIRYVLQIIGMQPITAMPDMARCMKGIIQMRGTIIPVYSMRLRFGRPEIDYSERTCIVVTEVDGAYIGLIVDAITEAYAIAPEDIKPIDQKHIAAAGFAGGSYLRGIAATSDNVINMLIDAGKLFEPSAAAEAAAAAEAGEISLM